MTGGGGISGNVIYSYNEKSKPHSLLAVQAKLRSLLWIVVVVVVVLLFYVHGKHLRSCRDPQFT